jgi:transposase
LRRLVRRFGKGNEKKAAVAIAHTLIRIAWTVMACERDYTDDGADFYDRRDLRNREHLTARYAQALQRLGYQVTLTAVDPTATDAQDPTDAPTDAQEAAA